MIMTHGDDSGLRVPPRLAPVQVLVTIVKAGEGVGEAAAALHSALVDAGVRVVLDQRTDIPFGRRAVDAELRGYPLRVEIGRRDLAAGNAVVVRRVAGTKTAVPIDHVVRASVEALDADQKALHDEALAHRLEHTVEVSMLDDALAAAQEGGPECPGRPWVRRVRPRRTPPLSPCAASCAPTAVCPTPRTSPASSPSCRARTERGASPPPPCFCSARRRGGAHRGLRCAPPGQSPRGAVRPAAGRAAWRRRTARPRLAPGS